MMNVIDTQIGLIYQGADITRDVEPYIAGFRFNDNADGEVDDIQITLEDRRGLWRNEWMPEKGDTVQATIRPSNGGVMNCGQFEVDEVDISGAPRTITIKAVSTPVKGGAVRGETKNRAWESNTLRAIAEQIAREAGVKLFYDGGDVSFDRVDQRDESDMQFLARVAAKAGYATKASDEQIVVYDQLSLQTKPAVGRIDVEDGTQVKSYTINDKTRDVFRAARIRYRDPKKNTTIDYTFTPEGAPGVGQTLQIRERVEGLDEAITMCKKALFDKNKSEVTGNLTMVGNTAMQAGQNVSIASIGRLDGLYHIERASHSKGRGGYETTIDVHRAVIYE